MQGRRRNAFANADDGAPTSISTGSPGSLAEQLVIGGTVLCSAMVTGNSLDAVMPTIPSPCKPTQRRNWLALTWLLIARPATDMPGSIAFSTIHALNGAPYVWRPRLFVRSTRWPLHTGMCPHACMRTHARLLTRGASMRP